jgi:uncharacterized protein YndB with AHSA1/START domain
MSEKNKMTLELVGDREIVMKRTFAAPARFVFDAWTKADLVAKWWAPKACGVEMVSCEADVRAGGKWRYTLRNPDTEVVSFYGEYREVTAPSRLVYTELFSKFPDGPPVVVTVTFEERDGRTEMTSRQLYPSKEVREMVVATGMEFGANETMNQLEELLLANKPRMIQAEASDTP